MIDNGCCCCCNCSDYYYYCHCSLSISDAIPSITIPPPPWHLFGLPPLPLPLPLHLIHFWVIGEQSPSLLQLVHTQQTIPSFLISFSIFLFFISPFRFLFSPSYNSLTWIVLFNPSSSSCLSPRFTLVPCTTRAVTPPLRWTLSPRLACTVPSFPLVLPLVRG